MDLTGSRSARSRSEFGEKRRGRGLVFSKGGPLRSFLTIQRAVAGKLPSKTKRKAERAERRDRLCRHPVFIVRPVSVIENGVLCRQVRSIWIQPRVDVLGLDWDDATVMARRRDFWRRLVGYRGKMTAIPRRQRRTNATKEMRRACHGLDLV
ncbi:hypothetical protein OKW43_005712 [Paraburkholderia sp. WC7.3g]